MSSTINLTPKAKIFLPTVTWGSPYLALPNQIRLSYPLEHQKHEFLVDLSGAQTLCKAAIQMIKLWNIFKYNLFG